jgi:exodeoxyribonuclease VII small subunit
MKAVKTLGYQEAKEELEAILEELENGEVDIDKLSTQLSRAGQLLNHCKQKLTKTDQEVKNILSEMSEEPEAENTDNLTN